MELPEINKIYIGNAKHMIKSWPDSFIQTCVTSPPYYGLRDYGMGDQIGLEETPEEFIKNLVLVFREVRRVLKSDGTLWVNIGDSYCSTAPGTMSAGLKEGGIFTGIKENTAHAYKSMRPKTPSGMKPKDLMGIPWLLAFALREDGWFLRQDIIWHKPNPMPESVTDRCTKSHEYVFLLSKSSHYYYDHESIKQPAKYWPGQSGRFERTGPVSEHIIPGQTSSQHRQERSSGNKERKQGIERGCPENTGSNVCGSVPWTGATANKRSVWSVPIKPFKESHFATFPEELITDMIRAGAPLDGIVFDPFMGAGTTALVSEKLQRKFIGIELNPTYGSIADKRIRSMFNPHPVIF